MFECVLKQMAEKHSLSGIFDINQHLLFLAFFPHHISISMLYLNRNKNKKSKEVSHCYSYLQFVSCNENTPKWGLRKREEKAPSLIVLYLPAAPFVSKSPVAATPFAAICRRL